MVALLLVTVVITHVTTPTLFTNDICNKSVRKFPIRIIKFGKMYVSMGKSTF